MGTREFDLEKLKHELGPGIERALNKVDYRSLRHELRAVGAGYHNIRHLSDDPPPANLRMGIKGFMALQRLVVVLKEAGIIDEVQGKAGSVVRPYTKEVLPSLDTELVDDERLLEAILDATIREDEEQGASEKGLALLDRVAQIDLARVLVVNVHASVNWEDRPRVNHNQQAKRLRIAGIMAKMLAGGLLLGVNVAIGVLSPVVFSLPTDTGSSPLLVALVGSAGAGLTTIGGGCMDLAKELG